MDEWKKTSIYMILPSNLVIHVKMRDTKNICIPGAECVVSGLEQG